MSRARRVFQTYPCFLRRAECRDKTILLEDVARVLFEERLSRMRPVDMRIKRVDPKEIVMNTVPLRWLRARVDGLADTVQALRENTEIRHRDFGGVRWDVEKRPVCEPIRQWCIGVVENERELNRVRAHPRD